MSLVAAYEWIHSRVVEMCPFPRVILLTALAIGVATGCGDDDHDESAAPGGEVQLETRSEVTLDEDEGNKDVRGIEVLNELPQLRRASVDQSVPAIRGSAGLGVADWLNVVNDDVATFWQQVFNTPGYRFPAPFQQIFSQPVRTRCGGRAPASVGPFYCPLDDTIFLPVRFFTREAQQYGDAGVAVIIAHENGHHVQDVLGVFEDRRLRTIQTELQADCLAGVWAASVLRRGLLEPDDIGEILGEVAISGDPAGTPVQDPMAHGSAELRQQAFFQGYNTGRPDACPIPPVPG